MSGGGQVGIPEVIWMEDIRKRCGCGAFEYYGKWYVTLEKLPNGYQAVTIEVDKDCHRRRIDEG